jgi:hypothetical protein
MNAPVRSSACPQDGLCRPKAARHDLQHLPTEAEVDDNQLPFAEEVMTGSR